MIFSTKDLPEAGDNFGAAIREESNGNHWRSSDDSEADAVEEEPLYKRFGAPNSNLSL